MTEQSKLSILFIEYPWYIPFKHHIVVRIDDIVFSYDYKDGLKSHSFEAYQKYINFEFFDAINVIDHLDQIIEFLDVLSNIKCQSKLDFALAVLFKSKHNCSTRASILVSKRYPFPSDLYKYLKNNKNFTHNINIASKR